MKALQLPLILLGITLFVSCQKSLQGDINLSTENYLSPEDFFTKNEAALQTYTVNGAAGGSFTSPQGTKVTIPGATFVTLTDGTPVINNVSIQFRDIYKKSDMLLSRMPTTTAFNQLLQSGGEFYIKATANDTPLQIAPGKIILVEQPIELTGQVAEQQAFAIPDSVKIDSVVVVNNGGWVPTNWGSVSISPVNYIFSLYQFNAAADSGTWCNSDNPSYFNAYPQTTLTLNPKDDITQYHTEVFLLFKNIASMVHVYIDGPAFPYYYAPSGLQCTLVAVGVKDGQLYSSFVPITITANITVNFTLSLTNADDFKAQLRALD
jgi:hypothetical protein